MKAKELRKITDNYSEVLYNQILERCTYCAQLGGHEQTVYVDKKVPIETVEKLKSEGFIVQLLRNNSGIMVRW